MSPNVGVIDRIVRFVLGLGLLGLYGAVAAPWRYFTLLGLVLIGTAFVGFCPLYRLLHINTAPRSLAQK